MTIGAKATACSPCGTKPLDIMVVLDRTGSMNEDHTEEADARQERHQDVPRLPRSDERWVGLTVFPPASSVATRCATRVDEQLNTYNNLNAAWTVVPLSQDYKTMGGGLNPNSDLVKTLDCAKPGGSTHYTFALQKAKQYLVRTAGRTCRTSSSSSRTARRTAPATPGSTRRARTSTRTARATRA